MDLTMIGIFVGLILTGMVAGIPIGQALEHRRLLQIRRYDSRIRKPLVLAKEEIDGISLAELGEILEAKQR